MYKTVCYEKPFLKEVIVRVDFSSQIEALGKALPLKIGNAALKQFPISEPRKAIEQELRMHPTEFRHKQKEFTEWNFFGREREKRLALGPACIFVTYSKYSSYEALKEDFISVLKSLFTHFNDLRGAKLGLRYINKIDFPNSNPFEWEPYIDPRLLGLFDRFKEKRPFLTRVFNIVDFQYDNSIHVKFQFGTPNPDFPATIRRSLFVLDIDGYIQGLQDISEIQTNLDEAHMHVQELFEESITDNLRGKMNVK